MSIESENPYTHTLHGAINGKPHSIEFDVRQVLADRAEREGEVLTEEELDTRSGEHLRDLQRMQEARQVPYSEPSRLERAAAKIGTRIASFIHG